jgi:4-diphosphocytidyl-2C-methyl-D-erythritol kinase
LVVVVLGHNATKEVFASVTQPVADGRSERISQAVLHGNVIDIADLGSALEDPAQRTYPEFATALASLREQTEAQWHVTGSGGAVFALARNARAAHSLAGMLRDRGFTARAVRTVG